MEPAPPAASADLAALKDHATTGEPYCLRLRALAPFLPVQHVDFGRLDPAASILLPASAVRAGGAPGTSVVSLADLQAHYPDLFAEDATDFGAGVVEFPSRLLHGEEDPAPLAAAGRADAEVPLSPIAPSEIPPNTPGPATVRATGPDGLVRWRDGHAEPDAVPPATRNVPVNPPGASPPTPGAVTPPPDAVFPDAAPFPVRPSASPARNRLLSSADDDGLELRLAPIIQQLPLELQTPELRALQEVDARVALSTRLVKDQLARGKVVVPAGIFALGLPHEHRAPFQKLDPDTLIPIPLQEVFAQLPAESLERRGNQVEDRPTETITTPFSAQAQEDARRFAAARPPGPAAVDGAASDHELPAPPMGGEGDAGENLARAVVDDPRPFQAILMREDAVDLASALLCLSQLPGVQGVVLSRGSGSIPLAQAGTLADVDDLLRLTGAVLGAATGEGPSAPETVTVHLGDRQASGFAQGGLRLAVAHAARPFRPGVRETLHTFLTELARRDSASVS